MRKVWSIEPKLEWDSVLPKNLESEWSKLLELFKDIPKLSFSRPACPLNVVTEPPTIIIFSDASIHIYGAVAYLR